MGIVPHPPKGPTPGLFKVVTLRPQKVKGIGKVDAGVDVTEQLGTFRHLQSLVDGGDVIIVPNADFNDIPVATPVEATEAEAPEAEAEAVEPSTEEPQAEPDGGEPSGDGNDGANEDEGKDDPDEGTAEGGGDDSVEYMEDPTGFTVKEVVAYAHAHPEHVEMLLEMETEGKNRTGVIQALTAMVGSD